MGEMCDFEAKYYPENWTSPVGRKRSKQQCCQEIMTGMGESRRCRKPASNSGALCAVHQRIARRKLMERMRTRMWAAMNADGELSLFSKSLGDLECSLQTIHDKDGIRLKETHQIARVLVQVTDMREWGK